MYEIWFETNEPYEKATYGIEYKVANDPMFRPTIPQTSNHEDAALYQEWMTLMKQCWEHDPSKRPHFEQIVDAIEKWKK